MLVITQGENGREFSVILNPEQAVMLHCKAAVDETTPSEELQKILEHELEEPK